MRERISAAIDFGSRPGAIDFMSRRIMPRFCMSARTAAPTPGCGSFTAAPPGRPAAGVLDLHGDVAPVLEPRAVDLPDRGRGARDLVEGLEDVLDLLAVLLLDDLLHVLEGDLRRGVAELGELGLELLAVLGRDEADVEERHHLAELHRRALHRPH